MSIYKGESVEERSQQLNEILRNIILTSEDIAEGKLTEEFYARIDISDSKKAILKNLLDA